MLKSKGTHPIKWQEARNEPAQEPDGERDQGKEKERKVKKKKKHRCQKGGGAVRFQRSLFLRRLLHE